MLSLAFGVNDIYEYQGKEYKLDLAFDNVLRVIDLTEDNSLSDVFRANLAIDVLFADDMPWPRSNEEDEYANIEEKSLVLIDIFTNYIVKENDDGLLYDIDGNKMPSATNNNDDDVEEIASYSLTQDADYIYASFLQDYNIDLLDSRGEMHWYKFRALLESLRDDTTIKTIIGIRQAELPSGKGTEKERNELIKLKNRYKLKD
ncbi:bacteriophage Gp15 family protein [Listeria innocua]|nr:bacteriophage Gp15 family protein [Listeria innocua]EKJ8911241.1 bacteriophage Gp15 family protein [Listeria innocua]EKJ8915821.1 bacteriophage Gp15 family protein [Listeria innocua]EKJ8930080.1 bacteriophage Gp15 family protein [Listeria innocua]EKJ8950447.1 bacteriophage Gp15 family protein [Listeria innocua]